MTDVTVNPPPPSSPLPPISGTTPSPAPKETAPPKPEVIITEVEVVEAPPPEPITITLSKQDFEKRKLAIERLEKLGVDEAQDVVDQKIAANQGQPLDVLFPDTRTAFQKKEDVDGVEKYIGSPTEVYGIQYDGDNWHQVNDFCGEFCTLDVDNVPTISTKDGLVVLAVGDHVTIRRHDALIVKEDVEVVKDDVFDKFFRLMDEPKKPVDKPFATTVVPPVKPSVTGEAKPASPPVMK
jgi:hypothetical protein